MVTLKKKIGKWVVVIVGGKRHFTLLHHWRQSEDWILVSWKEFWDQRSIAIVCKICFFGSLLNFIIPGTMRKWLKVKE
jgi:hypothetical protein